MMIKQGQTLNRNMVRMEGFRVDQEEATYPDVTGDAEIKKMILESDKGWRETAAQLQARRWFAIEHGLRFNEQQPSSRLSF